MSYLRKIDTGTQDRVRRTVETELAHWVMAIEWDYFVTATIPWKASDETTEKKFRHFHNAIERVGRTRVAYVASRENLSKSRECVPNHLHFVLKSTRPLQMDVLRSIWHDCIGSQRADAHKDDAIKIQSFDRVSGALCYLTKHLNDPRSWWDFRWLECFSNTIVKSVRRNHSSIRSERRWNAELSGKLESPGSPHTTLSSPPLQRAA